MPTTFPQTRRSFLPILWFLPVLVLCLSVVRLLLPGEALTNYRYAAGISSPPGSTRQLQWQENNTGHSLTRPKGSDVFLVEGVLAPGEVLLIPSFYGTVAGKEAEAATRFCGSPYALHTESGSFSLQIHTPFLRVLHLRVLDQSQLKQITYLNLIVMVLGLVLILVCLLPGFGKQTLLITGLYLLLNGYFLLTGKSLPSWVFTGKLLFFNLCPLSALLSFKRRYRIVNNKTDTLVSFAMVCGICLIYYHFDEFTRGLLILGTGIQMANLWMTLSFAGRHDSTYAPAARDSLIVTQTAFLGLWLSLTLGISGSGWLVAAILSLLMSVFLLQAPPQQSQRTAAQIPSAENCPLYFTDFEGSLKKLGFDSKTIARINHKCNTSNNHLQHVAEYTRVICIAMGFSAEKTYEISCAALLHDIGKLEIPDAILFDSGKLTNEAFMQIQSHNRLGYDLLQARDTEFFRLAAEVALQHHERMDGTGYLKRKGEEIFFPARIVAVADVFDALTAPRVYKRAWDFETAFAHIVENRGIHFDSKVVDDFIKCKQTIRQIYDTFIPHN